MVRIVATCLIAAGFCVLQSGCCCCRLPMVRAPIVQAPPIVIEQPKIEIKPQPADFTYVQSTGQFKKGNEVLGTGYSGKGQARNNPAMQAQKDGPIPQGRYWIAQRINDFKTGEPILVLHPEGGQAMNRIGENFDIQADSQPPGNAPGIVLPRDVRDRIQIGNLTKLEVVP